MWECSHVQQLNQGRKGTRRFSSYRFQVCPSWISTAARSGSGVSPREYKIHACELCALGCTKYATVQNVQSIGQNPAVKCPLGRTKPAARGSRPEERRGSGAQSLATMSGATTNYTRANVRFCQAFASAGIFCYTCALRSRPIRTKKPLFLVLLCPAPCKSGLIAPGGLYKFLRILSTFAPFGLLEFRAVGEWGGGRETRHPYACVRAFQVPGRLSNKSRQFSYLPGVPLRSRRLSGTCKG